MSFKLQPLDFSEMLSLGISVGKFYQEQLQIETQRRFQNNMYNVYRSQRSLNEGIQAFNFQQRLMSASRQASSVKTAFASVGLSGGTIADDILNYRNNLIVASISE